MVFVHLFKRGKLGAAGRAPRGPEIDDDGPADLIGQLPLAAVERVEREIRRGTAAGKAVSLPRRHARSRSPGQAGSENHDDQYIPSSARKFDHLHAQVNWTLTSTNMAV